MKKPSPYPGPTPFSREQNESFFGRKKDIRTIRSQLRLDRIVLLHSPSGAGKTSLLQAGLTAAMEADGFRVIQPIRVNMKPPKKDYRDSLFNRFEYSVVCSIESLITDDTMDALELEMMAGVGLNKYFECSTALHKDDKNLLLIFDQFEEIFQTKPDDAEARLKFFATLGRLLRDQSIWALFSMREESIGKLERYKRLIPGLLSSRYYLDYLTRKGAEEAIKRPAKKCGIGFDEKDEAWKGILDDLMKKSPDTGEYEPVIDPLHLQLVCQRIWETLPDDASEITKGDVDRIIDQASRDQASTSPVEAAIQWHYDKSIENISQKLGFPERQIREWINDTLIEAQRYRRQVRQSSDFPDQLIKIKELLCEHRLLRQFNRNQADWCELSHDRMAATIWASNERWCNDPEHLTRFQLLARKWHKDGNPSAKSIQIPPRREVMVQDFSDDKTRFKKKNATEVSNSDAIDDIGSVIEYERSYLDLCEKIITKRIINLILMFLLFGIALYSLGAYQKAQEVSSKRIFDLKNLIIQYQRDIVQQADNSQQLFSDAEKYQGKIKKLNKTAKSVKSELQKITEEKADLENKTRKLQFRLDQLVSANERDRTALQTQVAQLQSKLDALIEREDIEIDNAEIQKKVNQLQQTIKQAIPVKPQSNNRTQMLNKKVQSLRSEVQNINDHNRTAQERERDLTKEVEKALVSIEKLSDKNARTVQNADTIKEEVNEVRRSLQQSKEQSRDASEKSEQLVKDVSRTSGDLVLSDINNDNLIETNKTLGKKIDQTGKDLAEAIRLQKKAVEESMHNAQ